MRSGCSADLATETPRQERGMSDYALQGLVKRRAELAGEIEANTRQSP